MDRRLHARAGAPAIAIALAACGPARGADEPAGSVGATRGEPRLVASNVLRADYAGSDACDDCHGEIAEAWATSPMREMTRRIETAEVHAPFDGGRLAIRGEVATMTTVDGARLLRLDNGRDDAGLYRITKIVGGRYREDFVGIDVTGAADPARDPGRGAERVMPVSWRIAEREWVYKGYSVQVAERPGMMVGVVWHERCLPCHNTLPALSTWYDELLGKGAPSYQGSISDGLLPPARSWRIDVVDQRALRRALEREIRDLGGDPAAVPDTTPALLHAAIDTTRARLDERGLVELGIGCEACHGGAREHAEDPSALPSYAPRSPLLEVARGDGADSRALWINRSCARCHTVLFSRYPHTWEGGRRKDAVPGGSTINSGEARDFLLGGCASAMACTTCHDPHAADDPARLAALATPAGNATCTACHPALAAPDALAAHSRHDPAGAGASCVACHMPKKNLGLDNRLTRYHRIGSPNDPERVLHDRPLECALCHDDKGVRELVEAMEAWWGTRYDRKPLHVLYGDDLGVEVLAAMLARGRPHEHAVALGVYAERGRLDRVAAIADHLAHRLPIVRLAARAALEDLTGERPPVDIHLPAADARRAARAWAADWRRRTAGR